MLFVLDLLLQMQEEKILSNKRITYFLFVNSKSGGEKGKQYLTLPNRKLSFQYSHSTLLTLYLADLFSAE